MGLATLLLSFNVAFNLKDDQKLDEKHTFSARMRKTITDRMRKIVTDRMRKRILARELSTQECPTSFLALTGLDDMAAAGGGNP